MSLLERIKRKQQEIRQESVAKVPRTEKSEQVFEVEVGEEESSSSQQSTVFSNDDIWIQAKSPKKLEFIPNQQVKRLDPNRLIWANYHSWNTVVPARLCDNQEALSEPTIKKWPIPPENVVVEVFGQVKGPESTRLLLVDRSQTFPFWAQSVDCEESDYETCDAWNNYRVNFLKKKVTNYILSTLIEII
jgi:hypothetical protein